MRIQICIKISRNHNHFKCYFQKVLPKWKLNFNPSEQKGQLIVSNCFGHNIMQVPKYIITLRCRSHKTKWALMVVIVYYVNWIGLLPKPVFVVLQNLRRGVNCHLMTNDIYLHNVHNVGELKPLHPSRSLPVCLFSTVGLNCINLTDPSARDLMHPTHPGM